MDSLGGILTKGLLGNPILAHFNLFYFEIIVTETPTPTVTDTPTPTPTLPPTPTPLPGDIGLKGNSHAGMPEEKREKTVRIAIKFKSREYVETYTLNDRKLRITINIVNYLNKAANKLRDITLKFKRNRD